MSGSYDATFRWPHPGASDVIVTGSFDGWSCSHHLTRTPSGFFEGTFQVPWGETVQYKYIVDGRWTTTDDQPTELDPIGNLNNVLRAPARPPTPSAPAQLAPVAEEKKEDGEGEKGVLGTVLDTVNGHVEFVKQAAVGMVEAIAPGTTETPAETPVVEKFESKPEPALEEKSAPALAPEPSAPASDLTASVLPTRPSPDSTLPEVPVAVLPLSTEPPVPTTTLPSADVSESKPLETTVVEGSATEATAVEPVKEAEILPLTAEGEKAKAAAANGGVAEEANVEDVAASKPLETTIVEGSATAETAVTTAAAAPAAVEAPAEEKPSTHVPAEANGKADDKPAVNGSEPTVSAVNGTNGVHASDPAPQTNGTQPATNGAPASPAKAKTTPPTTPPASNGTSPASTPAKEKRMRFPSLSSRSLHARSRSSAESALNPGPGAGEFGEGKSGSGSANGSVASRKGTASASGTERAKRRTSMFGKLKDIFHHKHEASQ